MKKITFEEIKEQLLVGSALSDCQSTEDVVALINRSDAPDLYAAAWVYSSCDDNGFGFGEAETEAYASQLADAGAEFDYLDVVATVMHLAPLSSWEISEFAESMIEQMSDDDKESFLKNPGAWRDGIMSDYVIVHRGSYEVFCNSDEFDDVAAALEGRLA